MTEALKRLTTALADRYRVERELGAGGMATVYLAEDLKHRRAVAVKVLRPELAAVLGAERFLKEIEVTANLQHPNILPLYDSGEADGFLFYVMPHVVGESLRDRLTREGQLPIDDAVAITRAVAAALDSAHRRGVIHRDIKPENILLSDGQALVADFGIALAVSTAGGSRMTETGMSLGTPHYMSPEQAMGDRTVDGRSDVYSLGATAYEMLVGEPPFTGPTAQAILAKVVTAGVAPLTELRKTVPPHVDAAVRTALEKIPADRFATAAEFAAALGNQAFTLRTPVAGVVATARPGSGWRRAAVTTGIAAAALAVVAAVGWLRPREAGSSGVVRFAFDVAAGNWNYAVSPDGRQIAYSERGELLLRSVDLLAPRNLGRLGSDGPLVFSPDGTQITDGLNLYPVDGGPPRQLPRESQGHVRAWGDDGYLYVQSGLAEQTFGQYRIPPVNRVPASGGTAEVLLAETDTTVMEWVTGVLPGGRVVLGTLARRGSRAERTFQEDAVAIDPASGTWKVLVPQATSPRYLEPGYLLYAHARSEGLLAVRFDPRRAVVTSEPVAVEESPGIYSVAVGGTTMLFSYFLNRRRAPFIRSRAGARRALPNIPDDVRLTSPALSRDGNRVAFQGVRQSEPEDPDLWVYELPEGPLIRLREPGTQSRPTWSPDARHLLYARDGGYSIRSSDGTGEIRRVLDGIEPGNSSWLPSGDTVVVDDGESGYRVLDLSRHGANPPDSAPMLSPPAMVLVSSRVSPDGQWIASSSVRSGTSQLYVQSRRTGTVRQVSRTEGYWPVAWSRSGRELFFLGQGGGIELARLRLGTDVQLESITAVPFDFIHFDVFPGDSLFLTIEVVDADTVSRSIGPVVVVNLAEELERRFARRER